MRKQTQQTKHVHMFVDSVTERKDTAQGLSFIYIISFFRDAFDTKAARSSLQTDIKQVELIPNTRRIYQRPPKIVKDLHTDCFS